MQTINDAWMQTLEKRSEPEHKIEKRNILSGKECYPEVLSEKLIM